MKRRQLPIVLTSILLGILFDAFFYGQTLGLNVFLFTMCILGGTFYLLRTYKRPVTGELYGLGAATVFFSFMAVLRASPLLLLMNIVVTLYLLLLIARLILLSPKSVRSFTAGDYVRLVGVVLGVMGGLQTFFDTFGKELKPASPKRKWLPVLRGIILALPVLALFIALFAAADPVFHHYASQLFSFNISSTIVFHVLDAVFFSFSFLGMYMWLFMAGLDEEVARQRRAAFKIGNTEAYIILGSVAVLFLLFILIQVTYLFGGVTNVVGTGLTYAQYARKGFFELVAVAAITLGLIRAIDNRTVRRSLKDTVLFIWLSAVLVVEVFVIMASALKRLALYEQTYGFTTSRLYGHLFIGWLALAFLLLFFHIMREKKAHHFTFQLFVLWLLFFAVINLLNPAGFVAHQDFQRYSQNGKIDIMYISSLPDDATPAFAAYLHDPNPKVQHMAIAMLAEQRLHHPNIWHHWRSFSIAQNRAQKIFVDNKALLDKYPHEGWTD